jgi:alkanesulfonate monooxygenase SsuD/methylene tetrahydromethanopterin reductase-like flavin-dependent oxidoreductase (luciferase family)
LVIAASSPQSLAQAARHGFAVVTTANWFPIEEVAAVRRSYDEQLERADRSPDVGDFSCRRFVYVSDSRADMLQAAEQGKWICRVSAGFRDDRTQVVEGHVSIEPAAGEPSAELFAERMIFGDAETCIEKLERLRETLRPTRLLYNVQLGALPHDRVRRSLERFAERVAPHFEREAVAAGPRA